jgi:hypothetical protein
MAKQPFRHLAACRVAGAEDEDAFGRAHHSILQRGPAKKTTGSTGTKSPTSSSRSSSTAADIRSSSRFPMGSRVYCKKWVTCVPAMRSTGAGDAEAWSKMSMRKPPQRATAALQ